MKKLLPLLLAALLMLSACGGNGAAGGDTSSENNSASAGQSQQEETQSQQEETQSQGNGDQSQPEEPAPGGQSQEPEETAPAEEQPEKPSSGGQTRPAGQPLSAQGLAAMEKVTYYGDRGRCAMTREQAEAYGQFALTYDENDALNSGSSTSYVFLADFDGNGNPYLVFVHPAPGMGAYAPEVYAYADGQVQRVCSCWDGSASGSYLKELKDGRVLYIEWTSTDDGNSSRREYAMFSNGGLVETTDPGNDAYGGTGTSPSLYELCSPGWNGSQVCSSTTEAAAALLLAGQDGSASDRDRMAAAMVDLLFSADPYGSLDGFLQAKLVDLDRDGAEELFTMDNWGQAMLYSWQGGALQGKNVGVNAGGTLRWYLCQDTETGELGIEYESMGGGYPDFSSWTYYYPSRTEEIGTWDEIAGVNGTVDQTHYNIGDTEVTKEQFDAAAARHQRLEILDGGENVQDGRQATVDALLAILAK